MAALLLLLAVAAAPAAIHFDHFKSLEGLRLVRDATIAGQALRITPAKGDRAGAVWLREKQPVAAGFDTTFQFQITKPGGLGHGADGFAFVLQNSGPDAVGGRGSAGGFAVSDEAFHHDKGGIPWSIAVFFDTFRNKEEGDPSANYVSFRTYGRPDDMRWPAPRLAFTPHLRIQLKDQKPHTARILFRPPLLSVFLDGDRVLEAPVDLSLVLDPQGSTWVGFTASTGGGYENHDILNWTFGGTDVSSDMSTVSTQISFHMSACLPGRNLCTPERAAVETNATGYHVILPANLEWGASIPNPDGRKVEVTNAHGVACWDAHSCAGPTDGLIVETHGNRTWFSLDRAHGTFKDNQGFYEFDVSIK